MSKQSIDSVVVLGPTASGKTTLGVQLARAFQGEIVSADSRQVYRRLDIGSGKDLGEYGDTAYHLIDIADLETEYSVFDFQRDCFDAVDRIRVAQRVPIIVGGTGMYIESVTQGYTMAHAPENETLRAELAPLDDAELAHRLGELRPNQHNTTDTTDRERLIRAIEIAVAEQDAAQVAPRRLDALILGTRWPRAELHHRIDRRLRERLDIGMIEEVERLIADGISPDRLRRLGLEYRYILEFLEGTINNKNDLYQKLRAAIVNFAKRQETWFRRMERRGAVIHWIERADISQAISVVRSVLPVPR